MMSTARSLVCSEKQVTVLFEAAGSALGAVWESNPRLSHNEHLRGAELETAAAPARARRLRLEHAQDALKQLEKDTNGSCVDCGETIPAEQPPGSLREHPLRGLSAVSR
jgi:hypothetical protein